VHIDNLIWLKLNKSSFKIGKVSEVKMEVHLKTDVGEVIKGLISICGWMTFVPYLVKVGERFKWLHQIMDAYATLTDRFIQRKDI